MPPISDEFEECDTVDDGKELDGEYDAGLGDVIIGEHKEVDWCGLADTDSLKGWLQKIDAVIDRHCQLHDRLLPTPIRVFEAPVYADDTKPPPSRGPCWFGSRCLRSDCWFDHPNQTKSPE